MDKKVWTSNRPRFIVTTCTKCGDDRRFHDDKSVYNQNLGLAYSNEEIVEVLNQQGLFSDYFFELIQIKIWYCQGMFHKTNEEKYKTEEECLKQLRDEMHDESSIFKYSSFLKKYHEEQQ